MDRPESVIEQMTVQELQEIMSNPVALEEVCVAFFLPGNFFLPIVS